MEAVQNAIHRLEVGGGIRYFRVGAVILGLLVVAGIYDLRCYQNMSTQEAMDSAQLARNIAQGKGYTTSFIRPLSMRLLKEHNQEKLLNTSIGEKPDSYKLQSGHPDLANPPAYPLFLAGLMKLPLFKYEIPSKPSAPWFKGGVFRIYEPDFVITVVNQLIFFAVLVLVFCLAKRLFDKTIAWTSALILGGTEVLWRFTNSGLSTMFLLLIFTLLVWTLVLIEEETREPKGGPARLIGLGVAAGLLVTLGALTRYSFGWTIIPVVIFVGAVTGIRQAPGPSVAAFLAFLLTFTPWVARNFVKCGMPFGTATYSIIDGERLFADHGVDRSLKETLNLGSGIVKIPVYKLILNARHVLGGDLPRISGSWVSAFFLVGLLVSPPAPSLRRLRYFLVGVLGLLVVTQALGETQLSQDSPEVNSENLLVLLAPLVVLYGVSFFYLLLEHVDLPFREARYIAVGLFILVAILPLAFRMLPPTDQRSAYNPPALQITGGSIAEKALTISDVPWAMAWYGQRDSVYLPTRMVDLFEIDRESKVKAIFISRKTLQNVDSVELSRLQLTGEPNWGVLILKCLEASTNPRTIALWPKAINPVVPFAGQRGFIRLPLRMWEYGWPERLVLKADGVTLQQLYVYKQDPKAWLFSPFQEPPAPGMFGPVSIEFADAVYNHIDRYWEMLRSGLAFGF